MSSLRKVEEDQGVSERIAKLEVEDMPQKRCRSPQETEGVYNSDDSIELGEIPEIPSSKPSLFESIFGKEVPSQAVQPSGGSELHEFLSDKDAALRYTDIPERIQLKIQSEENTTTKGLQSETEWLLQKISPFKDSFDSDRLREKIFKFLSLYKVDKYEVQYISRYLMIDLIPDLDPESDLPRLAYWDRQWAVCSFSKSVLSRLIDTSFGKRQELDQRGAVQEGEDVCVLSSLPESLAEIMHSTSSTDYLWEISDLEKFTEVYISPFVSASKINRRNFHPLQEARANNLYSFFRPSTLTPDELCENIQKKEKRFTPYDPTEKPQELAFPLRCKAFPAEIDVIKGACQLQVDELSGFPRFRQLIRAELLKTVLIFTSPTAKGQTGLDLFHPYYRVKNLAKGKPWNSWTVEMLCEALYCEKEGFISIEIKLPENSTLLADIKQLFLSVETEDLWNKYRDEVISLAFAKAYEDFVTDFRNQLQHNAQEWLISKVQRKFYKRLVKPSFLLENGESPVMGSFAFDTLTGNQVFCIVDPNGVMLVTYTFKLLHKKYLSEAEKPVHLNEKSELVRLLVSHRPNAIVVGANSLQAVYIYRFLNTLLNALTVDTFNPSSLEIDVDIDKAFPKPIALFLEDIEVPRLFSHSFRSKTMLSDCKQIERLNLSLARYAQHPLLETLGLMADPTEMQIKYLKLSLMQELLSESTLLEALVTVATEVCASKGIEINQAVTYPHKSTSLAFMPGLGPVKAHCLVKEIKEKLGGTARTRQSLLNSGLLTPKVFENCIAFLQISGLTLDATRIHPNQYEQAILMANSAIHEPDISKVMQDPSRMNDLDLETYIQFFDSADQLSIGELYRFIRQELMFPFGILKQEYNVLPPIKLFYLCSSMNKHILKIGSIVQVMALEFDDHRNYLKTRLDCGLEGTIDSAFMNSAVKSLPKGQLLNARVIEIIAQEDLYFKVKLSALSEDMTNHSKFLDIELDRAFVICSEDWISHSVMEDDLASSKYTPRAINHQKFRNIGYQSACEELSNKDIGSFLFRPSKKGKDCLVCSWKFFDHVIAHFEILEEDKPDENTLGTNLRISNEVFCSLDDVIKNYIKPCEQLTKESLSHPSFLNPSGRGTSYVTSIIEREKNSRPSHTPFRFTVSPQYPQYFLLMYMPEEKVVTEFIKVKPKGLFFHEAYHPSMSFLISWFRNHHNERVYLNQLSRARAPAMPKNKVPETETSWQEPQAFEGATPFMNTPRIGRDEWSGGMQMNATPRADHWGSQSNFQSWTGNKSELPEVPTTSWGSEEKVASDDTQKPRGCFNCGETGHMSRECPQPKSERRGRGRRPRGRGRSERTGDRDENSGWGTSQEGGWGSSQGQEGGWGSSQSQEGGWGSSKGQEGGWGSSQGQEGGWGSSQKQEGGGWGSSQAQEGGWGSSQKQEEGGWGGGAKSQEGGWGSSQKQEGGGWGGTKSQEGGWGAQNSEGGGSGGWGAQPQERSQQSWGESSGGTGDSNQAKPQQWGNPNSENSQDKSGGWGNSGNSGSGW